MSFFTDLSGEMIYPLLPTFLASLGGGPLALGLIEGISEATASFFKLFSGSWTDRLRRRKPLVLAGYALSHISKPFIGFATQWPMILAARFFDRMGKGIRTSPRDALISDLTEEHERGRAFGIQRSMDHAGAVLGPLIAASLLSIYGLPLRTIFFLAVIPGMIAVAIIAFRIQDAELAPPPAKKGSHPSPASSPIHAPKNMNFFLLALLLFTLARAADSFFLLRFTQLGFSALQVTLIWAGHNAIKMVTTYSSGKWADRFGSRKITLLGWALFSASFASFAWIQNAKPLAAAFLIYALFFGLTEPAERKWVSQMAKSTQRGTAFGWYHLTIGFGTLPANLLFSAIYAQSGARAAFLTGAGLSACATLLLSMEKKPA